jgi:hypothetical protein
MVSPPPRRSSIPLPARWKVLEERQDALGQRRRGDAVVCRERRVGEEVFLAGVKEELGWVGRVDQRLGADEAPRGLVGSKA